MQSATQQNLPLTLTVYSAKGQTLRSSDSQDFTDQDVYLKPTEEVLGVSVRWCSLSSSSNLWHVLEVYPSSPAEIAGSIPFNDYIIGSPERVLHGEGSLGELVDLLWTVVDD